MYLREHHHDAQRRDDQAAHELDGGEVAVQSPHLAEQVVRPQPEHQERDRHTQRVHDEQQAARERPALLRGDRQDRREDRPHARRPPERERDAEQERPENAPPEAPAARARRLLRRAGEAEAAFPPQSGDVEQVGLRQTEDEDDKTARHDEVAVRDHGAERPRAEPEPEERQRDARHERERSQQLAGKAHARAAAGGGVLPRSAGSAPADSAPA